MNANEVAGRRDQLERQLQVSGPIQFIRDLIAQTDGVEVRAQPATDLGGNRSSTRYVYRDRGGAEASLIVISDIDDRGRSCYALQCGKWP